MYQLFIEKSQQNIKLTNRTSIVVTFLKFFYDIDISRISSNIDITDNYLFVCNTDRHRIACYKSNILAYIVIPNMKVFYTRENNFFGIASITFSSSRREFAFTITLALPNQLYLLRSLLVLKWGLLAIQEHTMQLFCRSRAQCSRYYDTSRYLLHRVD